MQKKTNFMMIYSTWGEPSPSITPTLLIFSNQHRKSYIGLPVFTAFHFIAIYRCCIFCFFVFYKLRQDLPPAKDDDSFYCNGLKANPQYFWGMPVCSRPWPDSFLSPAGQSFFRPPGSTAPFLTQETQVLLTVVWCFRAHEWQPCSHLKGSWGSIYSPLSIISLIKVV